MTRQILSALAVAALIGGAADAACPLADPADCVYVDDNCVSVPGAGTQADPFCTIQDAYNSVVATTTPADPATILVLPGTYAECVTASSTFDPDPAVNDDRPAHFVADAWLAAGSPNPSHLDPTAFEQVALSTSIAGAGVCDDPLTPLPPFSIAGTGASLRGFAIMGGGLAGVEARGPVDVANNLVASNLGQLGGGIQLVTATCAFGDLTATIRNNVLRENLADDFAEFGAGSGGGIFVRGEGRNFDIGCAGGSAVVRVADNYLRNNAAQNLNIDPQFNDVFASGGGIAVESESDFSLSAPEDTAVTIVVSGNTLLENTVVTDPALGLGLGGGIFASTLGFGAEALEIADNRIGPTNVVETTSGFSFGGGISISAAILSFGLHEVTVRGNTIFQNQADIGGGMDALVIAEDLDLDQRQVVEVVNNKIQNNTSLFEGGGLNVEYNAIRSLDADDEASVFPGAPLVAAEMSVLARGNIVVDNVAGTAGGGVVLRVDADADPLSPEFCIPSEQRPAVSILDFRANYLENNLGEDVVEVGPPGCSNAACQLTICTGDPFCCDVFWDQICADSATAAPGACNCATSDCCEPHTGFVVGAGVLALARTKGQAFAAINLETSTIVGNDVGTGFVGGLETSAVTVRDCDQNSLGSAELNVDRCIIAENDATGFGGPPFDPVVPAYTIGVTKTSVFGHPDSDYEGTIFPGGPPSGNIPTDPLLDPATFVPDLCSPVYDVGSCSGNPSTVCFSDDDCGGGGSVCHAEGAGYLAPPDLNGDDAVDGVDVNRFSLAFGADEDDSRYTPAADIDRNGLIDGVDLPLIAPLFGEECVAP